MAKGDDKRVRSAIDTESNRVNSEGSNLSGKFNAQYDQALGANQQTYKTVNDNLSAFKPTYNADTYLGAAGYSGGGGGDGGAGGTAFNIARGIDPGLINVRGGIDNSLISGMGQEAYGGYQQLAQGLKQPFWDDYNKYRDSLGSAIGGYQNFANTGGFSAGDLDSIRAQAQAPTRAIYQQGQDNVARQQNLSGGNMASGPAAMARMTRDANQAIADVTTNNEANMAKLVQEGKLQGLSGLTGASKAGMDARTQVESLDANMRAQGLGGMTDIEKARLSAYLEDAGLDQGADVANLQGRLQNQGLIQSGDIAQAQLAESAAGRSASAGNAAAGRSLQEAMFRAGLDQTANDQYLQAQGGLTDLYGTTPGATQLANNSLLNLYGQQGQLNQGLVGQRIQGAQLPGTFQSAMGNIGSVMNLAGQVAAPFMGLPGGGGAGIGGGSGLTGGGYGIGQSGMPQTVRV